MTNTTSSACFVFSNMGPLWCYKSLAKHVGGLITLNFRGLFLSLYYIALGRTIWFLKGHGLTIKKSCMMHEIFTQDNAPSHASKSSKVMWHTDIFPCKDPAYGSFLSRKCAVKISSRSLWKVSRRQKILARSRNWLTALFFNYRNV